ncbi:MAG: hypothetical protein V3U11_04540, partial [Planctomycetota bacterium]
MIRRTHIVGWALAAGLALGTPGLVAQDPSGTQPEPSTKSSKSRFGPDRVEAHVQKILALAMELREAGFEDEAQALIEQGKRLAAKNRKQARRPRAREHQHQHEHEHSTRGLKHLAVEVDRARQKFAEAQRDYTTRVAKAKEQFAKARYWAVGPRPLRWSAPRAPRPTAAPATPATPARPGVTTQPRPRAFTRRNKADQARREELRRRGTFERAT